MKSSQQNTSQEISTDQNIPKYEASEARRVYYSIIKPPLFLLSTQSSSAASFINFHIRNNTLQPSSITYSNLPTYPFAMQFTTILSVGITVFGLLNTGAFAAPQPLPEAHAVSDPEANAERLAGMDASQLQKRGFGCNGPWDEDDMKCHK
jgi:hypothetical protein